MSAGAGEARSADRSRGLVAWLAVIVPAWLVLVLCTHWEPVAHDGWGHWVWHRNLGELSLEAVWNFAHGTYVHNNPRLGQVITFLLYAPGPWHAIATPIVELGLFYLLTVLVLGRRPSLRGADDTLLFATILAMAAVTVPAFGMMLFYRPFTGNYLYGLVINLALLVPYRLHWERARRARWWWTPALFVLGIAAGLCNEHTGPAMAALLALAVVAFWRRDDRIAPWAMAGLVGLIVGGIALFVAPGQDIRYNALATQTSTLGRIFERGVADNLWIVGLQLVVLLTLIPWLVLGGIARRKTAPPAAVPTRVVAQWLAIAAAMAITLTLLLSPKQGLRLYLASTVLACAGAAGWVTAQLGARWARALAAAGAAVVLVYAGYRCTSAYYRLGNEFDARVAKLDAAPDHAVVEIPTYSVKRSRWSQGDDLLNEPLRNRVSYMFGLALIKVKASDGSDATGDGDEP